MKTSLFSKDKFRQFWNYKNKKLTIAFIINWTIIALITVIFIIIGSIDMYVVDTKNQLLKEYNAKYGSCLPYGMTGTIPPGCSDKTIDDAISLHNLIESYNPIFLPTRNYIIVCALVIPVYTISSNSSLFFTKYLLSKKHNKNN